MIVLDYKQAKKEIEKIILKKSDILSSVVNFLYENFEHYNWVGIYFLKGNKLVLGPWKGKQSTEHIKIPIGKGICGAAAASGKTEIINDVNIDKRYLSCFVSTKSEIVVPIKKGKKVLAEIDIDSDKKNAFSKKDKVFLEDLADMLFEHIH
ncbi:MAG: GAF domain-containing protein [Candidatus Thermoplasmatota archaeon]|nr:GAF domain-containing protein [Candidatus Thermoplasmatota archaeon]